VRSGAVSRGNGGDFIQCRPQRLAHQLQPIEHTNDRQDRRRIATLLASRFEQALVAAAFEQLVEQPLFGFPCQQAIAKLAEHTEVEPASLSSRPNRGLTKALTYDNYDCKTNR
jgi:hypothetical protein